MPDLRLCDISSYYQAFTLDGADVDAFLQAQLSRDLTQTEIARAYDTAWCDAKGRVRCLLILWRLGPNTWRALVPRSALKEWTKLSMYVLRAAVRITACDCPTGVVDCRPQTPRTPLPGIPLDARTALVDQREADTLHAAIEPDAQAWLAMRMLSGIAQWPGLAVGAEIPQSLGLRPGQELALQKGCYPGQEIISRVHYRGRPPRRLVTTIGAQVPADAFAQAPLPLCPQWHIAQSLRSASAQTG